jgi:hypothetical protein
LAGEPISKTALAGIFTKHPYDGTPKSYFPRVAVTVGDWSRGDCWTAVAKIWWSNTKSEAVSPFSVCWGKSLGFSLNGAAGLHQFMQQGAIETSGNERGMGPKPPMIAIPDQQPGGSSRQLDFSGFVQQLILDTGWKAGAPTNIWIASYDASVLKNQPQAASAAAAPAAGAAGQWTQAKPSLEAALACSRIDADFASAEQALVSAGWNPSQGSTPVMLPVPLQSFGLTTQRIAVSRDSGEQVYRAYLPNVSIAQIAKAAKLKLGKDGKEYGRVTKLGVLTAATDEGVTTLTCTIDSEA